MMTIRSLCFGLMLVSLSACETVDDDTQNNGLDGNGQITAPDDGNSTVASVDTTPEFVDGQNTSWQPDDGNAVDTDFNTNSARPPFSEHTINFEYNSSVVAREDVDKVKAHARYLKANPHITLRLEGHADERGSREYNIALGQQRAVAVKRLLSYEGVARNRVATLSFGEEKPLDLRHTPDAWHVNRRVEFIYAE